MGHLKLYPATKRRDSRKVPLTAVGVGEGMPITAWCAGRPQISATSGASCQPAHDPEKWVPVFGKDHAQTKRQARLLLALDGVPAERRVLPSDLEGSLIVRPVIPLLQG